MQRPNLPTFRPTLTVWPAEPPSLPWVNPWPSYPRPQSLVREPPPTPVRVPEDFCFRECLDLQVESDEAVRGFVRAWGTLSPDPSRPEGASLPASGAKVEWSRDDYNDDLSGHWDSSIVGRDTLAAQRTHLTILRCLVRHYMAFASHQEVRHEWTRSGFLAPDERGAWLLFEMFTGAALSTFSMTVRVGDGEPWWAGRDIPSTYEVAVLQLVQAIAEGRSVQFCANERCGRPFTRQRGRARYDRSGHSSGVKYCSALCNKAQQERNRRARQRAARMKGEPQ